jgi:DNA-binding protein HU-beta
MLLMGSNKEDRRRMTVNKEDLISQVAAQTHMKKVDVSCVVEEVFEAISEGLAKGEKFQYIGFGSFGVKTRAARTGVNPRTKQKITIPARKIAYFVPGKKLADSIK